MTTQQDMTSYGQTQRHGEPRGDGPQPEATPAGDQWRSAARQAPTRARRPQVTPYYEDARFRAARLGFEAFLIALAAYLIGIAGLPPLFDAPGSNQSRAISSVAVDDSTTEQAAAPAVDAIQVQPAANALPGEGVSVNMGRATWSTSYFQAALFKALLEELGYEVSEPSVNEQGPVDMYQTMAAGSVQFWSSSWMPNHSSFLDETTPDGSLVSSHLSQVGNLLPAGGLEGLVITKSVVDEFDIRSLQQINDDQELVTLFDTNGNGKAEIYGCAADWGCNTIINEMLVFNGWDNLEQIAPDDYDTAIEDLVGRVDSGTPTMLYTWSPSGYLTRLRPGDNVLWLDMGGQDKLLDGSITADYDFDELDPAPLGPACTGDPCYLGWAAADIMVTARNSFIEANPSAKVLFEQVQLKVLDVALANVKYDTGENTEADLDRHAQEWIAENRQTVDAWIQAALAAS